MLMLFGFMLRAAAIEFRSKGHEAWWTKTWDSGFFIASLVLTSIVGLILGNLIQGLPLNAKGELEGGLSTLLTPYPLLISLFGLSCFTMHGALFLLMKTEGPFHDKVRRWAHTATWAFLSLWLISSLATFFCHPHMLGPFFKHPTIGILPLLSFLAILSIFLQLRKKNDGLAFLASCLSIFSLLTLFAIGTFPNIAYSSLSPENSLTFMNSSSSELALWIMVGVTLTGAPLSFFYFPYVYKVFKGKVELDAHSY
jgi:cytochrome d ubiquinol oxidase subunit II